MKIEKLASIMIAILLLNGCSLRRSRTQSHIQPAVKSPPLSESFAYERAASLAQVVPIKLGRFLLKKAVAKKSSVYLSFSALNVNDTNAQSLHSEINAISKGFCQGKKTNLIIRQGVTYHFLVSNAQEVKILEALVNRDNCSKNKFIVASPIILLSS